ncbi:hypothetical protein [Actinocrispum sp. NPDC049592]|uniref:hypothetical protein n=1 Tax=Actinocrispum sp. NPDC049592 TaxID=3154835 RepID=UPI00342287CC
MLVVLAIIGIVGVFALINVFTLVLPRQFLRKRQDIKNAERQQFAMSQGWQFVPYAPELLQTYGQIPPFTERGDRRVVFGVISGPLDGAHVTVFDYQRRTKVTSYGSVVYNDSNEVNTVWVVKLPNVLPPLHIGPRRIWAGNAPHPQTPDLDFNKQHILDGDLNLAAELFTPQVIATMRQLRLSQWAIVGNELIYAMVNTFTRTTPQEIIDIGRTVTALARSLPEQLLQRYPAAPQQPGLAPGMPPMGQYPASQPFPMQPPVSQPFPAPGAPTSLPFPMQPAAQSPASQPFPMQPAQQPGPMAQPPFPMVPANPQPAPMGQQPYPQPSAPQPMPYPPAQPLPSAPQGFPQPQHPQPQYGQYPQPQYPPNGYPPRGY